MAKPVNHLPSAPRRGRANDATRLAPGTTTVLEGDCRLRLPELPSDWFHCVVTSPPYWGLRDYKTPPLIWDGKPDCKHSWIPERFKSAKPDRSNAGHDENGNGLFSGALSRGSQGFKSARGAALQFGERCDLCCAWRGHLGLEPTPALYLEHMVGIFRQVRRVLRDDGVLWLNLGDTYLTDAGPCFSPGAGEQGERWLQMSNGRTHCQPNRRIAPGLKPKDLVGIPWRVAFALQQDGWYLRCDCIWAKTNPMPESVKDRPTKSHEYVFLLSKREDYFYDAEAVKEPVTASTHARVSQANYPNQKGSTRANGGTRPDRSMKPVVAGVNPKARVPSGWDTGKGNHRTLRGRHKQNPSFSAAISGTLLTKRNKRTVWTMPTQAYRKAHFATFPERLVEPCVLAGTSEVGCCPQCGAPWERIIGDPVPVEGRGSGNKERKIAAHGERSRVNTHMGSSIPWSPTETPTIGWHPTCSCRRENVFDTTQSNGELFHVETVPFPPVPCRVLDPFGGSGRTALVANRLGRDATLIELGSHYVAQIRENIDSVNGQKPVSG
jgi:DNA modification methylase